MTKDEPVQQHSDIIEQLQSKIQALTDENRLLKQRMDEAGVSYADIVDSSDKRVQKQLKYFREKKTVAQLTELLQKGEEQHG